MVIAMDEIVLELICLHVDVHVRIVYAYEMLNGVSEVHNFRVFFLQRMGMTLV